MQGVPSSISVVIPCYNYGRYLEGCVGGILDQDVDVDITIIDDASTDDTARIGEALAAGDPRVSLIRHEVNRGHIATYNQGLARARGTYCMLLSADDLVAPGALKRACKVLDQHPEVVLVYGDVLEFVDKPPLVDADPPARVRIWNGRDFVAESCREVWNPISTPSAVVRTSAQQRVGGYRPELPHAGDREMWLRLACHGDVAELQGPVQAFYRLHSDNMHRQYFYDALINEREFRAAYESFFADWRGAAGDREELWNRCRKRLAERGVWWGYRSARGRRGREALDLLRFSVSVWNDQAEADVSSRWVVEAVGPVAYAIRQRQRRRRHVRA